MAPLAARQDAAQKLFSASNCRRRDLRQPQAPPININRNLGGLALPLRGVTLVVADFGFGAALLAVKINSHLKWTHKNLSPSAQRPGSLTPRLSRRTANCEA